MQHDPEFIEHCINRFNDHQLVEWHERAAIYEFDAGMSREEAEYKAAMDILTELAQKRRKGHK
jgi:dsRNA-specific ribonuclease